MSFGLDALHQIRLHPPADRPSQYVRYSRYEGCLLRPPCLGKRYNPYLPLHKMIIFVTEQPARIVPHQYRNLASRRLVILSLLFCCILSTIAIDMALGPARYTLSEVISAVITPSAVQDQLRVVIWDIRMPTALMAAVVGACLAVAGAEMQPFLPTLLPVPLHSAFQLRPASGRHLAWWQVWPSFPQQQSTWCRSMPF